MLFVFSVAIEIDGRVIGGWRDEGYGKYGKYGK